MIQVTSREFRENQASLFNLADKGERIIIRRRGKSSYMLTPISDNDIVVSPELEKKIEEARLQYGEGETVSCKTKDELKMFLESL